MYLSGGIGGSTGLFTMVLKWMLLIATLHRSVWAQQMAPIIPSTDRPCSSSQQCVGSIGEICWWYYEGCTHGQCMCDPRSQHLNISGMCGQIRLGGEACSRGDSCPQRMSCEGGRCQCNDPGWKLTPDRKFCLKDRERLLGDACDPVTNVCFLSMSTGYHTKLVGCFNKKCRCKPGSKYDGFTCRKMYVTESCDFHHHCHGGALCSGKQCACPSGYFPAAGNSKCIKEGAQFDLGLGASCDEVNESRYCAQGLVCYRCPRESKYTCAAYVESHAYNSAFIGSGVQVQPTIFHILLSLLLTATFSVVNRCL